MSERWLFVDEIAAHLGVNPDTISKGITRKSMPAHKIGRLWKFATLRDTLLPKLLSGEITTTPTS